MGVASDDVVNSYKPNIPIIALTQRVKMLKALRCVSVVRPYYKLEYVSACKALNPDIFIIGEDWGRSKHNIDVETYLKSKGKKIIQVKYNAQTSSTKIKQTVIGQLGDSEEDYQPTTETA